jgi:hypothetical protein
MIWCVLRLVKINTRISETPCIFLEFASLIGLLLSSIWSRLWLSIKALVV